MEEGIGIRLAPRGVMDHGNEYEPPRWHGCIVLLGPLGNGCVVYR